MAFIELKQVSFSYPHTNKSVLSGIDLSLNRSQITAIVGPNGSGKTTLTKLLVGILRPSSGEILLESKPLRTYSLAATGRRIGYLFQNADRQFFCPTVAEEIGFGLKYRGCNKAEVAEKIGFYLDFFELSAYAAVFPFNLSSGEKQRVALAAILAGEPGFLVLDEPTAGLDARRKRLLTDYLLKIFRQGRGMVLVSHDGDLVSSVAEQVITLDDGGIREVRQKGLIDS